jgi:hypothetical protein
MRRLPLTLLSILFLSIGAASPAPGEPAAAGCSTSSVKSTVRAFASAYDRGRASIAERYFAPEPTFEWFSTGPPGSRLGAPARDRATLRAYLAARARLHEKLSITVLDAGYDSRRRDFDFGGKLIRTSDDHAAATAGRPQDFKGSAVCRGGRPVLFVWSM